MPPPIRICVYTSDMDSAPSDDAALLRQAAPAIPLDATDGVFLISHRYPKSGLEGRHYYLFAGYEKATANLCRRFLRILDAVPWLPTRLAALPLKICENEIMESLLAFDPDIMVIFNLRWARQLERLLKRHHPQWSCLNSSQPPERELSVWRRYDPSVKVSIVLPTYNGSRYLPQSVESCLSQTFPNIELIIVDDGSVEDIRSLITSRFDDPRIKFVRHEKNQGLPAALNTGFQNATGHFLTWTSDDNYYAETAIEKMVGFLQTYSNVDFVYAESYELNEDHPGPARKILRLKPPQWLEINNGIGACFLYRRAVYEEIGQYSQALVLAEDYEYWVRISKRFRMQRLNIPLYYYRYHGESLTGKHSPERIRERVKLVKQMHGISVGRDR